MGVSAPFKTTVKNVCKTCNNGWMGSIEGVAKRVLTPLILGESRQIDEGDQCVIALWAQKTALVSMLLSSAEDRAQGYGLPQPEYNLLYARREALEPLPFSQFWVGRYAGSFQLGSVWVTPLSVQIDGLPDSVMPHAYAMTIALGALLIHGIRYTNPQFERRTDPRRQLVPIWPSAEVITLASHAGINDETFLRLARGREFELSDPAFRLQPWRPATDLAASTLNGPVVELPALCGKHVLQYPVDLVHEAGRGRSYWFMVGCACDIAYLIHTEHDGAHARAADSAERIEEMYESLDGPEFLIQNGDAQFFVKRDESVLS